MQFDKTHIQIRNRTESELLDISLHVFRRFPLQILGSFLFVAIPLLVLNNFLLGHVLSLEYNLTSFGSLSIVEQEYTTSDLSFKTFLYLQILLIIAEAPLASTLSTLMLSKLIFNEKPTIKGLIKDARKCFWNILFAFGIRRGILIMLGLLLLLFNEDSGSRSAAITFYTITFIVLLFVRGCRPYMLEIILLERPGRDPSKGMTLSQRSKMLHTATGGNVVGRSMFGMLVGAMFSLSLYGAIVFFSTSLFTESGTIESSVFTAQWLFPISCWLAVCYTSVVRFLNYIDTRILLEGWEAELKIRTEAYKLEKRQQLGASW